MKRRFEFADAAWFRRPLKAVVIAVAVLAGVSIYPALTGGTPAEHERALFGLTVVGAFLTFGVIMWVAVDDSYIDVDGDTLAIHFEGFFNAQIPVSDIVRVERIDPRPRWRYRFGLSTNFDDRIACSHGGQLIEIELAQAWPTRVWPRQLQVRRFWIAVREHRALINELRAVAPHAFAADAPLARAA